MRRLIVLIVCLGIVAIGGGWFYLQWHSVSKSLSERMRQGDGAVVDFADIAPFAWDKLFVFAPYTSQERIQEDLGFPWAEIKKTTIEWNGEVSLVVFTRGDKVVYWFEHPRREDLEPLADPRGYARKLAKFTVHKTVDGNHVKLVKEN
jgi:hypothetical protein